MSAKTEWTLNATYQKIFDMAKSIIKEDAHVKFYGETKPIYIEVEAYGVRLGAALLQTSSGTYWLRDEAPDNSTLRPTAFISKNLSSVEKNSNIEREALGILHGLKKFHHYCFVRGE